MRSIKAIAAMALLGVAMTLTLQSSASAMGLASRHYAPRHGIADSTGTTALYASRIYRCKGGFFYAYLGGWGCDYYLSPRSISRR
jgi:hypothetical protein